MRASPRQLLALVILLLLTALALAPGNSDSRRLKNHEIFVAQTATEMLERDDLLVPHIMGELRIKKPPLSYWLSILAHRVLGESGSSHVSEFEVRLPSLISGLLIILVSYGLGLFVTRDPRGGLIAAGLIATSWSFYTYSRSGRPDMLYALLCALTALGFAMAVRRAEEGRSTLGAAVLAWGAFGLALMAKGPQFPLIIFLGVLITLLVREPRLPLLRTLHPWMVLPSVALPLAYFVHISFQADNVVSVWSAQMVQGADVPIWIRPLRFYYPAIVVYGLAPWTIALGAMVVDVWKRRDPAALLLANCVLVSLVLVSFAGKLRPQYVLPILPLCAALVAGSMLRAFDSARDKTMQSRLGRSLKWGQFGMVGVGICVVAFYWTKPNAANAVIWLPQAIPWLVIAGAFYIAAGLAANRNLVASFAALVGSVLFAWGAFSWIGVDVSPRSNTAYQFVMEVEAHVPEDGVLYFDSGRLLPIYYYGTGDLEVRTLKQWVESGETGPTPYFIVKYHRVMKSKIQGEILIEQQLLRKGTRMVLFRPAPRTQ